MLIASPTHNRKHCYYDKAETDATLAKLAVLPVEKKDLNRIFLSAVLFYLFKKVCLSSRLELRIFKFFSSSPYSCYADAYH